MLDSETKSRVEWMAKAKSDETRSNRLATAVDPVRYPLQRLNARLKNYLTG